MFCLISHFCKLPLHVVNFIFIIRPSDKWFFYASFFEDFVRFTNSGLKNHWFLDKKCKKPRPVVAGDLVENGVVIKSGLKVNEQIAISNLAKLRPETKVQIVNKEK